LRVRVLIPHCVDQMQDHNTEPQQLFGTNRGILLLTAIVLAALFFNAGAIPLFDEDEGAYAQVTQEMLRGGDLVTPRLGGELFFHKPPMIYWTQALSVVVVGTNELAFRLPSIVASMAWAVLLFLFVRRHLDQPTAGLAVFMLVTAMQLSLITRAAIADALLNLFITLTMFALFNYFRAPKKRLILVAYIGMALGFMTKGPIAVVIPVAVSGLFFLSQKQFKTWLRVMFHPAGWAVFLIIALPWYLVLINTHGWHFIREIFLVHNLGRFRSPMEGHSGSVAYYVPVVLVGLLPFTTLLIQALGRIRLALETFSGSIPVAVVWIRLHFLLSGRHQIAPLCCVWLHSPHHFDGTCSRSADDQARGLVCAAARHLCCCFCLASRIWSCGFCPA
jgi:4-amino-4-deoxy-L-arabinose transferase-like glycosyltransferase